mmetsp:Transcript_104218/g.299666  ORF Transcript_104218/g.299666 Transcript_104218/m.299666 type:complete len:264 (+) Transcript_104218:1158-1949(+)
MSELLLVVTADVMLQLPVGTPPLQDSQDAHGDHQSCLHSATKFPKHVVGADQEKLLLRLKHRSDVVRHARDACWQYQHHDGRRVSTQSFPELRNKIRTRLATRKLLQHNDGSTFLHGIQHDRVVTAMLASRGTTAEIGSGVPPTVHLREARVRGADHVPGRLPRDAKDLPDLVLQGRHLVDLLERGILNNVLRLWSLREGLQLSAERARHVPRLGGLVGGKLTARCAHPKVGPRLPPGQGLEREAGGLRHAALLSRRGRVILW